jgi:hypothetical protein
VAASRFVERVMGRHELAIPNGTVTGWEWSPAAMAMVPILSWNKNSVYGTMCRIVDNRRVPVHHGK